MEICLVRHAIAEERGPAWPTDALRPLTKRGRERFAEAAEGLRMLYVPETLVSSPLTRALETAEILLRSFDLSGLHIAEGLATGDHEDLLHEVERLGSQRVALVGHEPYISALLSLLLVDDDARLVTLFRKGAAALVTFEGAPRPGTGMLEWLLQPAALRAMAGARD